MGENQQNKVKRTTKEWLILVILILLLIAIGMFAINQTLGYFYKSQLLQGPCALCAELNPGVAHCISNKFNDPQVTKINDKEMFNITLFNY